MTIKRSARSRGRENCGSGVRDYTRPEFRTTRRRVAGSLWSRSRFLRPSSQRSSGELRRRSPSSFPPVHEELEGSAAARREVVAKLRGMTKPWTPCRCPEARRPPRDGRPALQAEVPRAREVARSSRLDALRSRSQSAANFQDVEICCIAQHDQLEDRSDKGHPDHFPVSPKLQRLFSKHVEDSSHPSASEHSLHSNRADTQGDGRVRYEVHDLLPERLDADAFQDDPPECTRKYLAGTRKVASWIMGGMFRIGKTNRRTTSQHRTMTATINATCCDSAMVEISIPGPVRPPGTGTRPGRATGCSLDLHIEHQVTTIR